MLKLDLFNNQKKIFVQFIDTHCHLYLPEFDKDLPEVFSRAEAAGVAKIFFASN